MPTDKRAERPGEPRQNAEFPTKEHALWDIVGMAESEGQGDVSENKHKYLAEAYADLHE